MNAHEFSVQEAEEKWIEKYRSALDTAPVQYKQGQKLRDNLKRVCATIAAIAGQVFQRWTITRQQHQVELSRAPVHAPQPAKRQTALPLASDGRISEKVG
jgi:uncharacterized membrane protein YebE (DUF533 family)